MATPSHSRKPSAASRPTTPLRPPSRTSLRASQTTPSGPLSGTASDPLAALEPAFAELSDSMADLEANFMHLQLLNESLNRFNECFGGFLYGLNMSAFCVDFPEAPTPQSFAHARTMSSTSPSTHRMASQTAPPDVDATFLTSDTTFVEHPPTTSKPSSRYSSVPSARTPAGRGGRGSGVPAPGRGGARGGSTSGLPRGGMSAVAQLLSWWTRANKAHLEGSVLESRAHKAALAPTNGLLLMMVSQAQA
ncbi:hypothetical protein Q7P36_006424 [Cladosporium allicinum]